MKALIEIKNVQQDWGPPFQKRIEAKDIVVEEDSDFDDDGRTEFVFRLLKVQSNKALIEYHRDYTIKGYEQPFNRRIWLETNETRDFSQQWGNNGLTKKITLKQILP